jgi:hypothetical protein
MRASLPIPENEFCVEEYANQTEVDWKQLVQSLKKTGKKKVAAKKS